MEFQKAEELLGKLFALSQAAANDFEAFRSAAEGEIIGIGGCALTVLEATTGGRFLRSLCVHVNTPLAGRPGLRLVFGNA